MANPRVRRIHGKFSGSGAGSEKIHGDGYGELRSSGPRWSEHGGRDGEWSGSGSRWGQQGGRDDDRRVATSWRSADWRRSDWRGSSRDDSGAEDRDSAWGAESWDNDWRSEGHHARGADVRVPSEGEPVTNTKPAWARTIVLTEDEGEDSSTGAQSETESAWSTPAFSRSPADSDEDDEEIDPVGG